VSTLGGRRLRGAEIEAAVDLERIRANDLSPQLGGEAQRERALARGGGTDDGDDGDHAPRV